MKLHRIAFGILTVFLLVAGCAGPAQKPSTPALPSPAAKTIAPRFYIVTFDSQGIARDRAHTVVDRERVRFLLNKGDIDRHTGIRIEVPSATNERQKNIEAFARAQQVARIFDLQGFDAVVVVLAKPKS